MAENQLLRCTPESQGIASSAILAFVDAADTNIHELHSLMLLRHGAVVAEGWWSPYGPAIPHMLFSLSKSFTSSAIGLAVTEGRLSVDDRVISFFPDDLPAAIDPNLAKMRVRDLLTMTTGHATDSTDRIQGGEWVKGFLALPVEREPGTYFVYNSGATFMLSAIVQKLTGMKLVDYLQPRLFAPLGIKNPTWETNPQGINTGGWGLNVTTEDIARFGQMYLQKGMWNGQRILPEAWVAEATSYQVPNHETQTNSDWTQGYGYQFWRCRHNAYRGDGAFGQYCIVMPDQDAVLAITSGVADMQQVLDLVWDTLLPAMQSHELPEDKLAVQKLEKRLAELKLEPPAGIAPAPNAGSVSGKLFRMQTNPLKIEGLRFEFQPGVCLMTTQSGTAEETITCGLGAWRESLSSLATRSPEPARVSASGVWTATDTFQVTLRYYETPFFFTLDCTFAERQISVRVAQNVGFPGQGTPLLTGEMV